MEIEKRRLRVVRLSAITRYAALGLAIGLPILGAGYWGFASGAEMAVAAGLGPRPIELDLLGRIAAAILSVLPALALSWGLWRLGATLRQFGEGKPFAPSAARGLRDFGAGVLVSAVLKPICGTALSVLLTWDGPRTLAVSVSSETLLLLLLGAVMTLMGWALSEAAALAEENAQFV